MYVACIYTRLRYFRTPPASCMQICVCMHTYIWYVYTPVLGTFATHQPCMYASLYMYIYIYVACIYTSLGHQHSPPAHMYTSMCVYVCIYIYIYACLHVYTYPAIREILHTVCKFIWYGQGTHAYMHTCIHVGTHCAGIIKSIPSLSHKHIIYTSIHTCIGAYMHVLTVQAS